MREFWKTGCCIVFGLLLSGFVVMSSAPASADEVEISGGGHLAGTVVTKEVKSGTTPFLVMKVDDDIQVAIQRSRVRRVRLGKELGDYPALAAAAGDDADKHYALAVKCKEDSLQHQYRYHMQRAITLDPDHVAARSSLKYVKDDNGNWVMFSTRQRSRGLVKTSKGWDFPEAIAKQQSRDRFKVASAKWTKEVIRLRKVFLRGQKTAGEALAKLQAIADPEATKAIVGELESSREKKNNQPRDLRLLWVDLLGKMRNSTATAALVKTGLVESDSVVREAAMTRLKEYGNRSANATYAGMLNPKKNSNKTVKQALRGMTYFPDPAYAMTYVDALVTVHEIQTASGPSGNTNAGFIRDDVGGNSFSTGSKVETRRVPYRNDDAHRLLVAVEPEADYGFNQQAWREHFARKLTQYDGSLRRDP